MAATSEAASKPCTLVLNPHSLFPAQRAADYNSAEASEEDCEKATGVHNSDDQGSDWEVFEHSHCSWITIYAVPRSTKAERRDGGHNRKRDADPCEKQTPWVW